MANDLNEEEAVVIGATTSLLGATVALLRNHNNRDTDNETRIPQIPHHPFINRDVDRENYINSVLYRRDTHCLNQIQVRPGPFFELCEMLEKRARLVNTKHTHIGEQVLIFLRLVGHNMRFRAIGGSEDKKAQFRWSKRMLKELLKFLADEVQKENQQNNTFKSSSFVAAADMISKKFNVKCLPDHVDNHLRTVKTACGIIAKLRSQPGYRWDENMRMIRMSPDVYNTYVEVNQTHEKYLNKKIDMYDEMDIVVGKDVARGSGAKSFDNVEIESLGVTNLEEKGDGDDEFVKENDKQSTLNAHWNQEKVEKEPVTTI
ncbi:hypothetical protein Cgig2_004498 [Carnegiea gigantea]|uniref:Uncharacterized protein n=1 Tax=Carnegiea gigantea TaxID=171969 RepID=A0A9Q1JYT6_9CARY|nr:hypothetical protein Cgig2_004498 [Carnegiea gigantea]